MKQYRTVVLCIAVFGVAVSGCLRVKTDPVQVEPIHITVDVNVRLERELEDFFGEIDEADPTLTDDTQKRQQ